MSAERETLLEFRQIGRLRITTYPFGLTIMGKRNLVYLGIRWPVWDWREAVPVWFVRWGYDR